jgi:hypothetical protein
MDEIDRIIRDEKISRTEAWKLFDLRNPELTGTAGATKVSASRGLLNRRTSRRSAGTRGGRSDLDQRAALCSFAA